MQTISVNEKLVHCVCVDRGIGLFAWTAGYGEWGIPGRGERYFEHDCGLERVSADAPVENPNPPDFEPDGTWFSMVREGDAMYAMEPNHGELDEITVWGEISQADHGRGRPKPGT